MRYAGATQRERMAAQTSWRQLLEQNRSTLEGRQVIGFMERLVQLVEARLEGSRAQVRQVAEELVRQARLDYPLVSSREVVMAFQTLAHTWYYGTSLLNWYLQSGSVAVSYEISYRGRSDGRQSKAAAGWACYSSTSPRAYALAVRVAAAVEAELSRSRVRRVDVAALANELLPLAVVAVGRDLSAVPSGLTAPRGRFVQLTAGEIELAMRMLRQYWVHGAALERQLVNQA